MRKEHIEFENKILLGKICSIDWQRRATSPVLRVGLSPKAGVASSHRGSLIQESARREQKDICRHNAVGFADPRLVFGEEIGHGPVSL